MTTTTSLRLERPDDAGVIESLHAELFGPERFMRAAYVLRRGVQHDPALSFVVCTPDDQPFASVRMTPIAIAGRAALILGPLVVAASAKGCGAGKALVRRALAEAYAAGHRIVLLVGDLPYYGPLGFVHLGRNVITLPAPVDPDRVLVASLRDDDLNALKGPASSI